MIVLYVIPNQVICKEKNTTELHYLIFLPFPSLGCLVLEKSFNHLQKSIILRIIFQKSNS